MRLSAKDIVEIRKKLGLSQEGFARVYHIPYATLAGWEQGMRTPQGAASVYLHLIQDDPDGIAKRVKRIYNSKIKRRKFQEAA